MSASEIKNIEAISKAIQQHNNACDFPALAILMNPFEVERLDWDDILGVPIQASKKVATGRFEIICAGDETPSLEEAIEEVIDAVAPETRERDLVLQPA